MLRRWGALALCLSVMLLGCTPQGSQAPEPVQAPPVQQPAPEPVPKQRSGEEWEAEGRRLVGEAKWLEAAQAYEEAAKLRPLADLWNEASYAYLMAERYDDTIRAGESALKLEPNHAYALYNTGMGYLEKADSCRALDLLTSSAFRQEGRWELSLALGRANLGADRPLRAATALEGAARQGAPAEALAPWQAELTRRLAPPSPADLARSGTLLLAEDGVSFYNWERGECRGRKEQVGWLVQGDQVERLLPAETRIEAVKSVDLPGGQRGYLVRGEYVGAGISRTQAYYLFGLEGGQLRPFTFLSPLHTGAGIPAEAEYAPSWSFPQIEGDRMKTGETNSAMGLYDHFITWQIDMAQRTVTQVDLYEGAEVKVLAVTADQLTGRFRGLPDDPGQTFGLDPDLTVRRAGKPIPVSELRVGEFIYLQMRDWQVFDIAAH